MCQEHCQEGCEHPEKLKGEPEECCAEQVRECHGGEDGHHCCGHRA